MNANQIERLFPEVFEQIVPCVGRQDVIEDYVLPMRCELGDGCMHCSAKRRHTQRTRRCLLAAEVTNWLHVSEGVQLDMQVLLRQGGLKCLGQRSLA